MDVEDSDGVRVVRLSGELDLVNADRVRTELVASDAPTVIADLTALEFIDSMGLSALLTSRRHLQSAGCRFEIRGAQGAARRVFEASGLEDVLDD